MVACLSLFVYTLGKRPIGSTLSEASRFFMRELSSFIAAQKATKADQLSTDGLNLFGLLTLIVDIRYRNNYGSVAEQGLESSNTILPDRLTPVGDGLEDVRRRRLTDGEE